MKKMKRTIYYSIVALIFIAAGISSCKKNTDELAPMRYFMPTGDIKATSGDTSVLLTWSAALNTSSASKVKYIVQISKDTLFGSVDKTYTADTTGLFLTYNDLTLKQKYFARIKTRGADTTLDSKWLTSSSFSIRGENLFLAGTAKDIQYYTAILRWTHQDGLTKITVKTNGVAVDSVVKADTILLKNLTPNTTYTAELFKGTLSKGTTSFTTKDAGMFTKIIDPTANIVTEINNLASGGVLGLMDGSYDLGGALGITAKNITIASVTGDPTSTTILNSTFQLKGANPAIKLSGLGLVGPVNGYIVDVDAAATPVGDITIENCKISFPSGGYAIVRANRGASAASQTMGTLTINNCTGIGLTLNNNYAIAMMDKMKFTALVIKNSTFTAFQRNIVSAATLISGWAPTITIDKCTFNNFGGGAKAAVLDGTTNTIALTISNTIFANTPLSGQTINNNAIVSGGTSTMSKVYYYNCNNGASPAVAITWPTGAATTAEINTWTAATTTFTLPAGAALKTAATDGGAVGDPRWAQ